VGAAAGRPESWRLVAPSPRVQPLVQSGGDVVPGGTALQWVVPADLTALSQPC
jgi:hypothetical protein